VLVLEAVVNVSEGRDRSVLGKLGRACGPALLDVHADADHHRSVFTLAGPDVRGASDAAVALARAAAEHLSLAAHTGVHPRIGAIDVVPFVALAGSSRDDAVEAAQAFAGWITDELGVPALLYGDADPDRRTLPEVRTAARAPGFVAHPTLGAVAVGARPVLVAVNCELDRDGLELARAVARAVRERDGGLPGVRALGLALESRGRAQVSMNLVDLERTGLEAACTEVRGLVEAGGATVDRVELVGLVPAVELDRCSSEFRAWSRIAPEQTIEARLALRR
jgi:glutamate formiminotransferase